VTSDLALRTTEGWTAGSVLAGIVLLIVVLALVGRAVWKSARGSDRR
jgi:hypothetical protein